MTVRRSTCFFALGLLVVALATSTGSTQSDPRTAEIKKRLERFGLKVTEVSFAPAKAPSPAVWAAGTAAYLCNQNVYPTGNPGWHIITVSKKT